MVSAARFLIVLDLRVVNIALPPRLHKSLGRPVGMAFTQGGVTGLYGDAGTYQAGRRRQTGSITTFSRTDHP